LLKSKNYIIIIILAIASIYLLKTIYVATNVELDVSEKTIDMTIESIEIHKEIITLDTHCDINLKNFTNQNNYTVNTDSQVNLPKMINGGLDVAWFIVFTGQGSLNKNGYKRAYKNAIDKFEAIHRLVEEYAPDQIELALSEEDVYRINAKGKKIAMIGVENAYPLGEDLSNIEKFYNLGARYMSLAHNGHSQFSDSNTGEEDNIWMHNGLSDKGKEAILEMNRIGIMIDVSHPSKEAIRQMIEISNAPVIASHSSARSLCNHSRNLDDEQLDWIKKNGGVVQTVALAGYLRDDISTELVSVKDLVDHIDYMVKRIGIDHVGISSDFDGGGGIKGWSDASETFNVTKELLKRGYTKEEISKIWSGNLLRVLTEVTEIAKNIQTATVE
jgi:microsomal dipeptidase-like Zn-dependent dipeptidase